MSVTSGPSDAVNAVVGGVDVQLVCPASDRHILVTSSRTVAAEVHNVVTAFAVSVFVEEHLRSVSVCEIQ